MPDLKVDIGPIVHEELQAQGPIGGDGSKVQRGEALLVRLIDVGAVIDQLVGHGILAHITGNVKCSVTEGIWFIDLWEQQIPKDLGIREEKKKAAENQPGLPPPPGTLSCLQTGLRPSPPRSPPSGSYLDSQPQQVTHDFDLAAGCRSVQQGVALLVLTHHISSPGHQQLQNFQMPCPGDSGKSQEKRDLGTAASGEPHHPER